jgi:hypothetical protein
MMGATSSGKVSQTLEHSICANRTKYYSSVRSDPLMGPKNAYKAVNICKEELACVVAICSSNSDD